MSPIKKISRNISGIPRSAWYVIGIFAIVALVAAIGLNAAKNYAPENVLVRVLDKGIPQTDAQCYGDVFAGSEQTLKKKPLRALASIYDFIDPAIFYANVERGFYLLETEFADYRGPFEVRIVCYTKDMRGVSYTVLNTEDRNTCDIREDGRVVVCAE